MEVKGTALSSIREFVLNEFGKEGFDRWLDTLSTEARELHSSSIKLDTWYPLKGMMIEPTGKICELFYDGRMKGAWDCGMYSADFALHGIYRLFVKMGSVQSLIKRASIIFPTYYRPSAMKVADSAEKIATLQITSFPGLETIVENRIGGWMQRAVEITGQKNVEVRITRSMAAGDPFTEFVGTWG